MTITAKEASPNLLQNTLTGTYQMNDSSNTNNLHANDDSSSTEQKPSLSSRLCNRKSLTRLFIASLILAFIIYVIIDSSSSGNKDIARISGEFLSWVEDHPVIGVFAVIGVYTVATILFIPGFVLTVGSGFVFANVFGLGVGVLLASTAVFLGASFGAICAFFLGRYLLRDVIETKMVDQETGRPRYPVLTAIDAALEQNGLRIVFLLRLSPIIPFNAINYILGVTAVPSRAYILSCLGMIPGTILYVFVGSSAGSLVESTGKESGGSIALRITSIVVGIVLGIAAVAATTFYAKKELKKIIEENENGEGQVS
uniref:VTT domain-containing protein n=1 Tax=Chaetoceros debilis TaxID=122233 RepID=A0A7S3QIV3_9STRA|mmetsp:Transcript_15642/g.23434  ORF Transcript_15642/g.23434 Transcript_15642/m.23434 type:complete len:313 (+) Transcript_15642:68-1006(+)